MSRTKSVINRDNNISHRRRDGLDKREKEESKLASATRNLIVPEYLTAEAKKEWARIVEIDNSRAKPIIYDSDISMLQVLCEQWAAWIISQREWAKKQNTAWMGKDTAGNPKAIFNPYVSEMRRLAKEMKPLYAAFAMTPQGRAQFGIYAGKNIDNDFDEDLD